jgi:zinc protease
VKTKLLADFYSGLDPFIARADTIAKTQALWGDAKVLNQVPGWIEKVTSADVQRVAKAYFTPANRSVIDRKLAAPAPAPAAK